MKKIIVVLVLINGLIPTVFAQKDQEIVDSIDFLRSSIDKNLPHLQIIGSLRDSNGYSYYVYANANKQIQYAKAYIISDSINRNLQWYYSGNHLIYAEQQWTNSKTNKVVQHQICYMVNDQLVKGINNNNIIDPSSEEFKTVNKILVTYEQSFLARYNSAENSSIK